MVTVAEDLADVVRRAQAGEPDAWCALVERAQDLAVGIAFGYARTWDDARDAAQDAFVIAYANLGSLEDPAAFPAWFRTVVRTACNRRHRTAHRDMSTIDDLDVADHAQPEPAAHVERADDERAVRAAVEALPAGERAVVALHYLGDMPYADVARFLGISEPAAKKRAWSARARLKGMLPMAADALAAARPSRTPEFRDTVLLFAAIRRNDHATVRRLVAATPSLVATTEDWTWAEGEALHLAPAQRATPLVRAAQFGDVELVDLLVAAGAPVATECGCAGGESPLWAATVVGNEPVVDYLLGAGAPPDATAFAGATPLHVAAQRGHHGIVRLLLRAGGDPDLRDGHGRTAADWAILEREARHAAGADDGDFLTTGIRALDLFAPLQRGGAQYWPAAVMMGQFVLLAEIAAALAPAHPWFVGFAHGPYDDTAFEHGFAEHAVANGHTRVVPPDRDPSHRRHEFDRVLDELCAGRHDKFVVCVASPGHAHDVTLALPRLDADPHVVTTIVVEAFTGARPAPSTNVPEGYDGQVAFDAERARRRRWPAIDPATTRARTYPSERHRRLAETARETITPDSDLATYLVQPFRVAEPFTSRPAERTRYDDLLDRVEQLLARPGRAPGPG
jgi:RNA polymerase sigma factor (sigma-70 family)